jgi:transcriptional regulator of acetoin/glycerol metabolism
MELLLAYAWPGNVRELDHVMERAVLMARGDRVTPSDCNLQPSGKPTDDLENMSLEEVERYLITKTLARFSGNAMKAAEALGLSRSAFYRRLEKYGL